MSTADCDPNPVNRRELNGLPLGKYFTFCQMVEATLGDAGEELQLVVIIHLSVEEIVQRLDDLRQRLILRGTSLAAADIVARLEVVFIVHFTQTQLVLGGYPFQGYLCGSRIVESGVISRSRERPARVEL